MNFQVKQLIDHDISSIKTFEITNDGSYAAIGTWYSSSIEIFNMKTFKKMQPIEAHKYDLNNCYFMEDNKAVSIDTCNLICWDVSDMQSWKKLKQIKDIDYSNLIHNTNGKLLGFKIL